MLADGEGVSPMQLEFATKTLRRMVVVTALAFAGACRTSAEVTPAEADRFQGVSQGPAAFKLRFYEGKKLLHGTPGLFTQPGDIPIEVGRKGQEEFFLRAGIGTAYIESPFSIVDTSLAWQNPTLGEERGDFVVYDDGLRCIVLVVRDNLLPDPPPGSEDHVLIEPGSPLEELMGDMAEE